MKAKERDTTRLSVLSLFSGAGGMDLGLEDAGMKTVGLCEIDPHCQKVLRRRFTGIPIYDDVSTLTGAQLLADGVRPDVVAFGSPCQDLSIAGGRAGLAGEKSGLFGEAIRIIRELRRETDGAFPTFAIWENVAGAFTSSSGRDFGAVLDALADAGSVVVEWGLLDAQHFGIAQRRRRVFVVACFDPRASRRYPAPLLPIATLSPRIIETRRQQRQDASASLSAGGGEIGTDGRPFVMRQREGKAGGGKGPLWSANLALSLKTGNDLTVFQPARNGEIVVRRLLPIEQERLMGWEDDYTRWGDDGSEIPDTQRYRMCGNGVAAPVASWVGKQVLRAWEVMHEDALDESRPA